VVVEDLVCMMILISIMYYEVANETCHINVTNEHLTLFVV
jgi:hypothetical protein